MTIEEFDTVGFRSGMKVIYNGETREIGSVCFEEKLIGLIDEFLNNPDCNCVQLDWIRCESCDIN